MGSKRGSRTSRKSKSIMSDGVLDEVQKLRADAEATLAEYRKLFPMTVADYEAHNQDRDILDWIHALKNHSHDRLQWIEDEFRAHSLRQRDMEQMKRLEMYAQQRIQRREARRSERRQQASKQEAEKRCKREQARQPKKVSYPAPVELSPEQLAEVRSRMSCYNGKGVNQGNQKRRNRNAPRLTPREAAQIILNNSSAKRKAELFEFYVKGFGWDLLHLGLDTLMGREITEFAKMCGMNPVEVPVKE